MKLRIQKTRQVKTPTRTHQYDAGLDFYIPDDMPWDTFTIWPGTHLLVPTGIKADIPEGFALFCMEKSSVATKGLIVGARVCDAEYQGEIHMHVMNVSKVQVHIKPGQKLAQFILIPVMNTEVVVINNRPLFDEVTERGEGAFGSTGDGLPARTSYKWDIQSAIEEQKFQKKLNTPEDQDWNIVQGTRKNLEGEIGDGITHPKPGKGTSGVGHLTAKEFLPDGEDFDDRLKKSIKKNLLGEHFGNTKKTKPSKGKDEELE